MSKRKHNTLECFKTVGAWAVVMSILGGVAGLVMYGIITDPFFRRGMFGLGATVVVIGLLIVSVEYLLRTK